MTTELGEAVARCKNLTRDGRDINTVNVNCDDLETILAELGRLSGGGDMLPDALMPVSKEWYTLCERRFAVDKITISGDLARAIVDAISTRPPALGELSEEKIVALYSELRHTSKEFCSLPHPMENWAEAHDAAIAKAAREFLGKVDG